MFIQYLESFYFEETHLKGELVGEVLPLIPTPWTYLFLMKPAKFFKKSKNKLPQQQKPLNNLNSKLKYFIFIFFISHIFGMQTLSLYIFCCLEIWD